MRSRLSFCLFSCPASGKLFPPLPHLPPDHHFDAQFIFIQAFSFALKITFFLSRRWSRGRCGYFFEPQQVVKEKKMFFYLSIWGEKKLFATGNSQKKFTSLRIFAFVLSWFLFLVEWESIFFRSLRLVQQIGDIPWAHFTHAHSDFIHKNSFLLPPWRELLALARFLSLQKNITQCRLEARLQCWKHFFLAALRFVFLFFSGVFRELA